jgi:SAM-dependent methyltransferase
MDTIMTGSGYLAGREHDAQWAASEEQEKYTLILGQTIEHYLNEMREIERRCSTSDHDHDTVRRDVFAMHDGMMRIFAQFEKDIKDEAVIKSTRSYFRKRTHTVLSKSYAVNRCRTWPQGYQGDYKTLEAAYRNTPLSDGLGHYLDQYIMELPLAHALRARIERLGELLREELVARQAPKVLSIACGSCRELSGLVPEIRRSAADITCIDLDGDALEFAQNRLSFVDMSPGQVSFVTYNALRLFDLDIAKAEFGRQDVIYSVGYFDYLPDDFLIKMLRSLYTLLNPGGTLIAAFKDADHYRSQEYHWMLDWDGFLQRKTPDFERLLAEAGIPKSAMAETRDKTGIIAFYSITR